MAPLRPLYRTVASFTATAPKSHLRALHMTEAKGTPSHLLRTDPTATQQSSNTSKSSDPAPTTITTTTTTRHFNTSRTLKAVHDSSTIDFAYMPSITTAPPTAPEITRMPLLPDNHNHARSTNPYIDAAVEPVMRPQIETASADSDGVVSAMSEVVDNHAAEIDPFELTVQVGRAAGGVVREGVERVKREGLETVKGKKGVVGELWSGFVDDLLGERKVGKV